VSSVAVLTPLRLLLYPLLGTHARFLQYRSATAQSTSRRETRTVGCWLSCCRRVRPATVPRPRGRSGTRRRSRGAAAFVLPGCPPQQRVNPMPVPGPQRTPTDPVLGLSILRPPPLTFD